MDELDKIFAMEAPQATSQAAPQDELDLIFNPPEESTYGSRLSEISERRRGEVGAAMQDFTASEGTVLDYGRLGLDIVGKGFFGTLADTVGETIKTGAHETVSAILSEKTADEAEAWLSEQIASGTEAIMSTEEAQQMLQWYQSLEPQDRRNIESLTNIVTGMTPAAWGKTSLKGGLKATGGIAKASAAAGKIKRQKNVMSKTFLDNSPNAKTKRADLNPTQLKLDNDILDTALTVKGIKPGAKPDVNISAIDAELYRLDKQVNDTLSKVTTAVPNPIVSISIKNRMKSLVESDATLDPLRKANANIVKGLDDIVESALKNFDNTPKGLRKLRTQFDNTIKRESANPKSVFHGDAKNSPFVKAYRDAINDLQDQIASTQGLDVTSLRNRQHKLILAKENLASIRDKKKKFGDKVLDFAKAHPHLTLGLFSPATSLLLKPGLAVGAAVGSAGYGAYKTATAPATRQAIGEALQAGSYVTPTATRSMFYGSQEENQQ